MAQQHEHVGMNKTGIQMSPLETGRMLDDDTILARGTPGDDSAALQLREAYIADSGGLGSIPAPGTMTGMVSMGVNMLTGDKPQILLDKMAERLAFERTGTRLYDALLTKLDVLYGDGSKPMGSITREQAASIRGDEARHVLLMKEAIESMGGDPTAQTPSADVVGVEAMGFIQILSDPRTSLSQSLHAIMAIELTDNAGWETLIALADESGHEKLVDRFSDALTQERTHLSLVQTWYEEAVGLSAAGMISAGVVPGTSGSGPNLGTGAMAGGSMAAGVSGADVAAGARTGSMLGATGSAAAAMGGASGAGAGAMGGAPDAAGGTERDLGAGSAAGGGALGRDPGKPKP
jgi:hypothetical protein